MKTKIIFITAALALFSFNAGAQFSYRMTFSGTRSYTNGTGKIVNKAISTRTLLSKCAADNGLTSTKNLSLVYHVNADPRGDQIEVVRNDTGAVICTPLLMFYPTIQNNVFDGGYVNASNTPLTRIDRILYVFDANMSSHSLGSALVNTTITLDSVGATNRMQIDGKFQYFRLAETGFPISIIKGKFTAKKPFFASGP